MKKGSNPIPKNTKKPSPPPAPPMKKSCKLIQWEKLYTINGISCCPECHEEAELILGVFGNPCWAHKPRRQ